MIRDNKEPANQATSARKKKRKNTYATTTISSPKAAFLWYEFEALPPAAHPEAYPNPSKIKLKPRIAKQNEPKSKTNQNPKINTRTIRNGD